MKHMLFMASVALVGISSLRANAPSKPGEGFGPHLELDGEGYGVVSFVAPKGNNNCYQFSIVPNEAALNENIFVQVAFSPRLVSNKKWNKADEKLIWHGPLNQETFVLHNHAGHRGIHGGLFAQDTHHNWIIRVTKRKYDNLADFKKDWQRYAHVTTPEKAPKCGEKTHVIDDSSQTGVTSITLQED